MKNKILGFLVSGAMVAIASNASAAPKLATNLDSTTVGIQSALSVTTGPLQLAAAQAARAYSGVRIMTCRAFQYTTSCTASTANSLSNTSSLAFGSIGSTAAAGTVTVTRAGVRSSVNVDLIAGSTGAAGFTTTGKTGQTYAISLPSSATLTNGDNTMTLDTFTDDGGATPTLAGGSDTFNVGGTLHVGASQAAGTYSGSISVTVNYN